MGDDPLYVDDPTFGRLHFDYSEWVGHVELPSFQRLAEPMHEGPFELRIDIEEHDELRPSAKALEFLANELHYESRYGEIVPLAVLQDLTGEGPNSRSAWFGALARREVGCLKHITPEQPDDLYPYLTFGCLHCCRDWRGGLILNFQFSSAWESEHGGPSVLVCDGEIVGLDYGEQPRRFDEPPTPKLTVNPFTGEPL
ncbi:hypothetical protein [Botrimarina sp.]|uniref:hypothetical protein n=1 Tax=Botrimarina sp. TaxID=2795802 RepID=UPI0032EEAE8E